MLMPEERAAMKEAAPSENSYSAYVVMRGTDYLRFSNYGKASTVRNPLAATLYSRSSIARRRLRSGAWINRIEVPGTEFKIVLVTFTLKGVKEATW